MVLLAEQEDFLCDIHDTLRIVLCNAVENVQGVNSDISLRVRESYQSIVQEDIKPLLIEFLLLSYQVGLTSVDDLIVRNVVFEVLDDFDSQVEIMISVTVDELAYVLSLVGTLLHNLAIVLE